MPARAIVTGIILIVVTALLVFTVEFFLPLSAKSDMNIICRKTLLKMEAYGELRESDRQELIEQLKSKGFFEISVTGTEIAKRGETLNLHVEAKYQYSRLTSLLTRKNQSVSMVYDKSSLSRRVVN